MAQPAQTNASLPTRDRILEGAVAVFEDKGFAKTSVQDLLGAGDVSRRTFYQYFRSKEDVLRELYNQYTDRFLLEVAAAASNAEDALHMVTDGVNAYLVQQQAGGRLLAMMQTEAINPQSLLAERREQVIDLMVSFYDQAARDAVGLALDPLVYRYLLLGLESVVLHLGNDGEFTDEDCARAQALAAPIMLQVLAGGAMLPQAD